MPRVDWSTSAAWSTWYGATRDGVTVGYGRDWVTDFGRVAVDSGGLAQRVDRFVALGIQPSDRVLIAGCGYGFTIEVFHGRGFPSVWGIDSSAHIAANRGIEAVGSTLMVEDDIRGGGRVRAALRSLTGDDVFDWVISESVLESYDDGAEMTQLLNAAESVLAGGDLSRIVHFVFVPPFAPEVAGLLNEKTIDQWNAVRPSHTWISDRGEVR